MKTIPRIGGTLWPACALLVLLLLLPFVAVAQEGGTGGGQETGAGAAVGEAQAVEPSTASPEGTVTGIPEEAVPGEETAEEAAPDTTLPVYQYIEGLKPGDVVMIAFDFDSSHETDLYSMSLALMRHCFDRGLRVVAFTLSDAQLAFMQDLVPPKEAEQPPEVPGQTESQAAEAKTKAEREFTEAKKNAEEKLDAAIEYVKGLDLKEKDEEVIRRSRREYKITLTDVQLDWLAYMVPLFFGEDVEPSSLTIEKDWLIQVLSRPIATTYIELAFAQMQKEYKIAECVDYVNMGFVAKDEQVLKTASEAAYVIDIATGDTPDWWMANAVVPLGVKLGIGSSYESADGYAGYLAGKPGERINGLIRGLEGAAEYEILSGHPGKAVEFLPNIENFAIPSGFVARDRPNDEGGGIAMRWRSNMKPEDKSKAKDEPEDTKTWYDDRMIFWGFDPSKGDKIETSGFEYYLYHSASGEEGTWEPFNVLPSDTGFIWEAPQYFGFFLSENRKGSNDHYTFYENSYPPRGVHDYSIEYTGMPILRGAETLADFDCIIVLSSGSTVQTWLDEAATKNNKPMAVGCTSTAETELLQMFDAGKINGLVAGQTGAEQYEWLMAQALLTAKEETKEAAPTELRPPTFTVDYLGKPLGAGCPIMSGFTIVQPAETGAEEEEMKAEDISPSVKALYEFINTKLPPGHRVLLAVDYGEADAVDLDPVNQAILKHCFRKGLKVVSVSLVEEGAAFSQVAYGEVEKVAGATYGTDFVNLGYRACEGGLIQALGSGIRKVFPLDFLGSSTDPDLLSVTAVLYDETFEQSARGTTTRAVPGGALPADLIEIEGSGSIVTVKYGPTSICNTAAENAQVIADAINAQNESDPHFLVSATANPDGTITLRGEVADAQINIADAGKNQTGLDSLGAFAGQTDVTTSRPAGAGAMQADSIRFEIAGTPRRIQYGPTPAENTPEDNARAIADSIIVMGETDPYFNVSAHAHLDGTITLKSDVAGKTQLRILNPGADVTGLNTLGRRDGTSQVIESKVYSSISAFCNLKPMGGEKIALEYVPPATGEERAPWDNPFEATTSAIDLTKLTTTKAYYILFSAPVRGYKATVLEAQASKDTQGNVLLSASGNENTVPDNRDPHWFMCYVVPIGYSPPPDSMFPPDKWRVGDEAGNVIAKGNPWNGSRSNSALWALLACAAVMSYIVLARGGASLFVRRIAGLDHVEEAIGRATEMGRPILYTCGLGYISDIATIASINILGQVARRVADYESRLMVPSRDPIIMAVCQEVIQEAYIDAGRPDSYNKDDVFFLTDDQFAYTAAVAGIMVREKTATNFFMGYFYAESLLLAETGASTGAIQIAGTDALAQLPFFITACDYTLIGEELYAASAYLSREPLLLGSLKGQDFAKMIFMILTFLGTIAIMVSISWEFIKQLFQAF